MVKTTHKIILGDALKVLKSIPNESIDLVFADPPYNMSKKNGLGWKYSKHITMQEEWDMFSKDGYLTKIDYADRSIKQFRSKLPETFKAVCA